MRSVNEYRDDPRVCWTWPPNFTDIYQRRVDLLNLLRSDPVVRAATMQHYKTHPVDFILDWATTYDPRKKAPIPKRMPFCLFPRQIELVWFLQDCVENGESGLIEKCRDAGATFVCAAFSVWMWLFNNGTSIGFGSRKEMLVDRIGDPDSIFQKIRDMIEMLPGDIFWPERFNTSKDMPYMKIINPETGGQIVGEAGDNIGRGGRKEAYFVDESAHLERPELVEAALGDNTDVRIDISSVNGTANVFYRRRMAGVEWKADELPEKGKTWVFVFDWRDHPAKDQAWYEARRAKAEAEGLLHIFAQEVERNYASAVQGVVIPAKWVQACIDAHKVLNWPEPSGKRVAGMDVADGGGDVNAMAVKRGYLLESVTATGGEADAIGKAYYTTAALIGVREWRYEVTGVGTGARAGANAYRTGAIDAGRNPATLPNIVGWNPSDAVVNPNCDISSGKFIEAGDKESRANRDHFANLKAQAWWHLRKLCHNTYRVRYEGADISPDECISIRGDMDNVHDLVNELSQPTYETNSAGKIVIDKKPDGSKSPNMGDSVMITCSPIRSDIDMEVVVGGAGIDSIEYTAVG